MDVAVILKAVSLISKRINSPAYVVGGFVRDSLLGVRTKKDLDIVIVGSGLAFAKAFAEHVGEDAGTLVEFPEFDTARFVFTEEREDGGKRVVFEVEFAGARTEAYEEDSRKPIVTPTTLEHDLSRRDFTVNAMAQEVLQDGTLGNMIDPYHGRIDLEHKLLRTPLDPNETFREDPLRMMRAARFAAQLGFTIEANTYEAMTKNKERLKIISLERIQEELFKLLKAPVPSIGLWILERTGLMKMFLPEISDLAGVEEVKGYSHKDNLSHTFAVVDNIAQYSDNALLRFAGLMHDIAKPATKKFVKGRGWTFDMHEHLGKKMAREICRRLRMSKKDTEYVANLVRWHLQPIALMDKGVTDTPVRRLIVNLGDDLQDLLVLCRGDITTGNQNKRERRLKNYDILEKRIAEVIEKDNLRAFQSPVRGEEIMERTRLKPGPTVGKIKKAIEEAILEGDIPNEYEAASAYFEKIKDAYLKDVQEWERNG